MNSLASNTTYQSLSSLVAVEPCEKSIPNFLKMEEVGSPMKAYSKKIDPKESRSSWRGDTARGERPAAGPNKKNLARGHRPGSLSPS